MSEIDEKALEAAVVALIKAIPGTGNVDEHRESQLWQDMWLAIAEDTIRAYLSALAGEGDDVVERLISALLPLAVMGRPDLGRENFFDLDEDTVIYENSGLCLTAGDCRRAKDVLTALGRMPKGRAQQLMEQVPTAGEKQ